MADEIEFVNGMIVKAPRDGAPDFVKCAISIKVAELTEWLSSREGEWVNLDVKESKGGRWYASVNYYKPKEVKREINNSHCNDSTSIDDDITFN